jgi:hypothetical protein
MAFDFPASPTVGQQFTPVGGVTYTWNGYGWDGGSGVLIVSDTPPASPTNGSMWWESDTGTLWIYYNDGNTSQWVAAAGSGSGVSTETPQCGRLTYVSATQLAFKPFKGDRIKINGVVYQIPAAGIAGLANTGVFVNGVAGQNLAASTAYLVYAFNNGGTITADFLSSFSHAPSTTSGNVGVEIKSGDDTRTLIGMISTSAAAQFQNSAALRCVLSWFNRVNIPFNGAALSGVTTTSTSFVELGVAGRVTALTWGEEAVYIGLVGIMFNTASATRCSIGIDSASVGSLGTYQTTAVNLHIPVSPFMVTTLSEGQHIFIILGNVDSGTATFYLAFTGMLRG